MLDAGIRALEFGVLAELGYVLALLAGLIVAATAAMRRRDDDGGDE